MPTEQSKDAPTAPETTGVAIADVDVPAVNDDGDGQVRPEPDHTFHIVGVGASAGGLDALNALLGRVQLDRMAFVIVQHLAPQHESLLPQLLARATHLQVLAAADGMRVEPNRVYVIPPNADLAILRGVLHLMPLGHARGVHLPVDYFLRSLADDQGARGIGVVLSGTGTDGTFGLKAIKEAGGITFVQEPSSARFDGMPRNALESGFADFCLTPEAIADELMAMGKHPYPVREPARRAPAPATLAKLLVLMRSAFGNDLSQYKSSTIERRIERRMALAKMDRLEDYLRHVQSHPDELRLLYKDMLIGVTSFFRDHDPFDAFKSKLLPQIMEHKQVGAPIRIWVPACSTGEEVYSYAICLLEHLDERAQDFRIQIFGSDIDEASIQHARRGIYPQNIDLDVSPERLHRFFVKRDGEYQVSRRIRDMVVFSVQNLCKDAPFSRLDLVSCRNLLIYLQPPMQRQVLRILHYGLLPQGFLVLGSSETVGDPSDLFAVIDRKNKLYARKNLTATSALDVGFGVQSPETTAPIAARLGPRPAANVAALADRKILELYGPPGVMVNEGLEVVHIRGRTGAFLEPTPGAPSFHLMRLARPELHGDLRRVIHEAQTRNARAVVESRLNDEGAFQPFKLEAVPVVDPESKTRSILVLFHEPAPAVELASVPAGSPGEVEDERRRELERELMVTKEYLQSTIEELESANEELKSSNEELQSSNEELQSTNEELETSKEELQSANEELTTVNDELHTRMGELQQTNDDLHNVLTGVGNPVVIVGLDLRIRRFTHVAERLLNLVPGDVGRSVAQLNTFIVGQRIDQLVARVIETLVPVDEQVLCADQRWYGLRITPYKTLDHSIKGAVIVLTDEDVRKRAADLDRGVADYAGNFLAVISNPLMILDRRLRVLWVNQPFLDRFQIVAEEVVGNLLPRVADGMWADKALATVIEGTIATGGAFRDHRLVLPGGGRRVRVSGSRIPPMGNETVLLLLAFEDDEERERGGAGKR